MLHQNILNDLIKKQMKIVLIVFYMIVVPCQNFDLLPEGTEYAFKKILSRTRCSPVMSCT